MASKKINSQSTSSKATDSKFSAEIERILGINFGSVGAVTRSKATMLGQQTLRVSSVPTSDFGSSTLREARSSTNASDGGSSVAEKIK